MAHKIIHSSKRHPDLAAWNARARTIIDRKAPADDNGSDVDVDLIPVTTFTYTDATDAEVLSWQETLDAEFPMVLEYSVEANDIDEGHDLGYATELTLSEINDVGGFIVTRNKFYC